MLDHQPNCNTAQIKAAVETFSTASYLSEILKLEDTGLPRSQEVIGFHGTSLFGLAHLARTGALLPSSRESPVLANYLYFFPFKGSLVEGVLPAPCLSREQAFGRTLHYADRLAKQHRLMVELGWDFSDSARLDAALTIIIEGEGGVEDNNEALRVAKQFSIDPKSLNRILMSAEREKGIVFGLSKSLCTSFDVLPTENDANELPDLRVYAPQGLPIPCFIGFEPVGDFEMMVFDQLRERHTS